MALAEYIPETGVIPFKGGSFEVKGLSLTDFTKLIRHHLPDLDALFELGVKSMGGKASLEEGDIAALATALADQAPGLVANIIALGAGETDEAAIQNAYRLPFPTQISALTKIAELTFSEVGGIKKAMESVAGLLSKSNRDKIKQALKNAP